MIDFPTDSCLLWLNHNQMTCCYCILMSIQNNMQVTHAVTVTYAVADLLMVSESHFYTKKWISTKKISSIKFATYLHTSSWSGMSLTVSGLTPGGSKTHKKSPTGSFLVLADIPCCCTTLTKRSLKGSSLSTNKHTWRFLKTGLQMIGN